MGARRRKGGLVSLLGTLLGLRSLGAVGGAVRDLLLSYSLPPFLPLPLPLPLPLLFAAASVLPRPLLPSPVFLPRSTAGVGTEQGRGLGRVQFWGWARAPLGRGRFSPLRWRWKPGTEDVGVRRSSARPHPGTLRSAGGFGGGQGMGAVRRLRTEKRDKDSGACWVVCCGSVLCHRTEHPLIWSVNESLPRSGKRNRVSRPGVVGVKLQLCGGAWAKHSTGSRVCSSKCSEMASPRPISDPDVGGGAEKC